jgi:hypothetical protein
MSQTATLITRNNAYDDLLRRTLSSIPCDLSRLIYLASTRDYNSGIYHHDGLAARFSPQEAFDALQAAHRDIFFKLIALPLEGLVGELEIYVRTSREAPAGFVHAWQELEPYRVAVPMEVDSTMVQLFLSNIRLALEVLKFRQQRNPILPPAASPQPLLGR